ncbi:MAG: DUF167 domain-containing protein [Planctomycetota bacterium]|jgi:uncharacterized protein YggU (UPF0235/DUF167 family)|nr:DUF167 domain-containing protein [Planctomycetota bacterium]
MCVGDNGNGARLAVRARAGGRKNALGGEYNGALKIEVTAAPERGKANRAIAALIAETCRLPASAVTLLQGETSRDKIFQLTGIDADTARERLKMKVKS